MKWTDIPFHPAPKALRQFAAAWLLFLLAFGAHQWLGREHRELGFGLGILALVVGVPGLIKPPLIRWLFVGWMVLAFPIGWLVSQVMLVIAFYGLITPIALLFRLRGRDPLARKPRPGAGSYWSLKEAPEAVRRYFQQY